MKKITRTTIKSFIKKNEKDLYIKVESSFNGMTDMVETVEDEFRKADEVNFERTNDFGIRGLWLVGSSRDTFRAYEDEKYIGYEVYNCCGESLIAIKK